jgi:hypothetical protein
VTRSSSVLASAVLGALVMPLVVSRSIGIVAAVLLGLVAGALVGAAQYHVWGDLWQESHRAWRRGDMARRRRAARVGAQRMLYATVVYALLVLMILAAAWLTAGRRPGAQALLLLGPVPVLLGFYAYGRWYARRTSR